MESPHLEVHEKIIHKPNKSTSDIKWIFEIILNFKISVGWPAIGSKYNRRTKPSIPYNILTTIFRKISLSEANGWNLIEFTMIIKKRL